MSILHIPYYRPWVASFLVISALEMHQSSDSLYYKAANVYQTMYQHIIQLKEMCWMIAGLKDFSFHPFYIAWLKAWLKRKSTELIKKAILEIHGNECKFTPTRYLGVYNNKCVAGWNRFSNLPNIHSTMQAHNENQMALLGGSLGVSESRSQAHLCFVHKTTNKSA